MKEKILSVIEKNSKISIKDLAIVLGEPEEEVAKAIYEMESDKTICGYHTEIISTGHQIDSVHFREVVNTLGNMVKTMTSLRCHAHFDQCYNFFTICLIPVNDCMITANRLV